MKHRKTNMVAFRLNIAYSRIWIKATGLSKYEYRERSIIHKLLVSLY